MHLSKIYIDNYRCFSNFEVALETFTVIIGTNNAGKTSLVQALQLLLHPGSDRNIPIRRDDFREQAREVVIEATFDDLDQTDTQAFFSLHGTPGANALGVRLEAKWEEGEIRAERYLTRPDVQVGDRRVVNYGVRYGQFLLFSYVAPYRHPERTTRFTSESDYRGIVSTYAGDFVQPIESLLSQIRMLRQQILTEIAQRGGFDPKERAIVEERLEEILRFLDRSPIADPLAKLPDSFQDTILRMRHEWVNATSELLRLLEEVIGENEAITDDLHRNYVDLSHKVLNLLQRSETQLGLISLRDAIMSNDDFAMMQGSLSSVLDVLLPEMLPSIQPFPVDDDRLFNEVMVKLGDTDLVQCGSGYQSIFAIGLRIVRILADALGRIRPRLLLIALEEPEAHLHPHKQRHLISALRGLQEQLVRSGLRTQFLVTTHSSNILSNLSFEEIVILRLKRGVTEPTKLDEETFLERWLDSMGISGMNRRVRVKKLLLRWLREFLGRFSETLFARFTLLLEGHSEIGAFPVWAKFLPVPNDLDQLGISILVGDGEQIVYGARLLEGLGIGYLLVCDRGDAHDLSRIDASRFLLTDHEDFEQEILAVLPMYKVLRAIEGTLTEKELDSVARYLTSRAGVPGLQGNGSWEKIVQVVQDGALDQEDLGTLQRICRDYEVGTDKRHMLKGADVGALLAQEAETTCDIPPVYWQALQLARENAIEVVKHG